MISILNNRCIAGIGVALCLWFLLVPQLGFAQGSLSLSLSPTLVEIGSGPGENWRSSIKVINSNPYDLTVYGSVVNFVSEGENGQGEFVPVEEVTGETLAEWIELTEPEIFIPSGSSAEVPFVVSVPEDAQPGGHFAAILIGTQPPEGNGAASVRTAQIVTSLFFLSVDGDVIEDGLIRSFVASHSYTPEPRTEIELRFENRGNVHLRPQGEIVIYNMWGTERGRIPINQHTSFGNALPQTTRKYDFSWEGTFSLADIGRYSAEAAIAYGSDTRKFSNQTATFWVVPVKGILFSLLIVAGIAWFILWAVRSYIRRIFALAGIDPVTHTRIQTDQPATSSVQVEAVDIDMRAVGAPVRVGVRDFRARVSHIHAVRDAISELTAFVWSYRIFFAGLMGVGLIIWLIVWYVGDATTEDRSYEVTIGSGANPIDYNAEELMFMRIYGADMTALDTHSDALFTVRVVNTSGAAGSAGFTAAELVRAGYLLSAVEADLAQSRPRSTIVFPVALQAEALALSEELGGVLLSAADTEGTELVLFVGDDLIE